MSFCPIAIVGRGCALPGALTPETLGDLSTEGRDVLDSAPAGRWRLAEELVVRRPEDSGPDTTWSNRGGYVPPIGALEGVDASALAEAFGPLGCEDPDALDPVYRYLLHAGRDALRDAGLEGGGPRIGAVVGNLSFPTAGMARHAESVWLEALGERSAIADPRGRFMSGLPAHALARAFRLDAGAFAIDAACASSLVAIEIACAELRNGRADAVLAGAVNAADDLFLHMGFRALEALSKTGQSRPFHAQADGLVPAEGAALVVLERLDDAIAAGRRIHGVIRGIGLSNDGRGRGLLVPSTEGQQRALRAAYESAAIDPGRLSWVECHATGTVIGDGTEVESMQAALGGAGGDQRVAIGSLKANMGHLITAAGGAGLIRVLEAMRRETLPPTPHLDAILPSLEATDFEVLTEARPWASGDAPRLAGVSAFGFGGNNAHLVVEEWRPDVARAAVPGPLTPTAPPIVIVAVGARVGALRGARALAGALFEGQGAPRGVAPGLPQQECVTATEIRLPLTEIRFPPRDLEQTLPQQLMLMEVASEALAQLRGEPLDGERCSVWVGMQCDTAVARHGARWRLADWGRRWGASEAWVDEARDGFAPLLGAAGVLGCMPNICANRLNSQLDWRGPSGTISSEELSGPRALTVASRMLAEGRIDAALVAAVDVCAEPAHVDAARAFGSVAPPADAAVALVMMRLDDAERRGETVLARVNAGGAAEDGDTAGMERLDPAVITTSLGHAHAASGLIGVTAAALACGHAHRLRSSPGQAEPWPAKDRALRVCVEALGGERATIDVASTGEPLPLPSEAPTREGPLLVRPVHDPPPSLPPTDALQAMERAPRLDRDEPPPAAEMPPDRTGRAAAPAQTATSPSLPDALPIAEPSAGRPASRSGGGALASVARHGQRLLERHQAYLATQAAAFEAYRAHQRAIWQAFLPGSSPSAPSPLPAPSPPARSSVASAPPATTPRTAGTAIPPADVGPPELSTVTPTSTTSDHPPRPRGRRFGKAELTVHASGRISDIFGPLFEQQDDHAVQVRMPERRLLLADRVTGLHAEPGVLGEGTVWTETDVTPERWFLHQGHMPAGLMIEAGQADLFLISYMGIDFLNRGRRAYRLLGCDVTYRRKLPAIGETLRYDIHVDGHAQQDDVRLFFFHYDCRVGDEIVLSVRNGQAGFFSEAELAASEGVLWRPEAQDIASDARLDPPRVACERRDFSAERVAAFAAGDLAGCFGRGFERAKSHTRTPTIQAGEMCFIDRVEGFDPRGGPWGRGYLKAIKTITPDLWFFDGHFKNDPCMPGTLMLEGCLQMMAFYLAALGYTIDKDGWRFEPVVDQSVNLRCRGQVLPTDPDLVCEIFVEEIHDGPYPTIYADLLGTVGELKAFHARRMGLRLVPDWPLSSRPDLPGGPGATDDAALARGPVAEVDGFRFDYASLLACAWGRPSRAFGPMYAPFDDVRRVPRLPGPPYHFMSRVQEVTGPIGGMQVGSAATIVYDIPPDAWYFRDNGAGVAAEVMPFAVLLEAVLQPCGWLASYVGSALTTEENLSFRNLDGEGVVHAEVRPDSGSLVTRTKLTNISQTAGMIIQSFDVTCHAFDPEGGQTLIYSLKTVFGFFPAEALANQVGLPTSDDQRQAIIEVGPSEAIRPADWPLLAGGKLIMIDRLVAFDPRGGEASLGRAVAEKDVDPSEWFFRAHFFQDPVQPGSLGLEAILQLLQLVMLKLGMQEGLDEPRFEPLQLGATTKWKYRGQVVPDNRVITTDVTVTERGRDERGPFAIARASLWVDGKRIYEADPIGMRLVDGRSSDHPRR